MTTAPRRAPPVPTGGALHPCAQCAAHQATCCERAEILVTLGDVERIRAHLGRDDFVERRVPDDPAYTEPDPDDPEWLGLTTRSDGSRRLLRRKDDRSCTFLASDGCVLPLDVRPLVCRLYPYAFDAGGLVGVDAEYCPTALFGHDRTMVEILGIPARAAEEWRVRLYRELRDGTP